MMLFSLSKNVHAEEGMETHSRVLTWRIPMDRKAWQATVHRVAESDTTKVTWHTHTLFNNKMQFIYIHIYGICEHTHMCLYAIEGRGPASPQTFTILYYHFLTSIHLPLTFSKCLL